MRQLTLFSFTLLLIVLFAACSTNSDSKEEIVRDRDGLLMWGLSPAVDGVGILFETNGVTYGAPGDKSDYESYFSGEENSAEVTADFVITGEKTVRGWGVEFPAIKFLKISKK